MAYSERRAVEPLIPPYTVPSSPSMCLFSFYIKEIIFVFKFYL